MSFRTLISGYIRGINAENYAQGGDDQIHINPRGDLIVTQALPEEAELVRLGDSYAVMGAAVALVTAVPTTTAGLSLWNGEPANGKSYVIDSCGVMDVAVDATQTDQTAIVAMMNKTPVTAPTDAALTIVSLNGRSAYGGKARTLSLGSVTNDGWIPLGNSVAGAAAVAGSAWKVTDISVRGLYIVPPGGMFSIAGIKVAAAASGSRYFIRWHEVLFPVKS